MSNNMTYENSETPYKSLQEALRLVKMAVQGEREDELFYDYLISVAPTEEEKEIILSIRDDEIKHNKMFREIYAYFTGEEIPSSGNGKFEEPNSYIEGVKKAFFGELSAMERYRIIRAGMPIRYYRDMVFEILTDEMKHADKYNYILNLNLEEEGRKRPGREEPDRKERDQREEELRDKDRKERDRRERDRRRIDRMDMDELGAAQMEDDNSLDREIDWMDENEDEYATLEEMIEYLYPLVYQAMQESREDADMEEVFTKYILAGALVGSGYPIEEVINLLEGMGMGRR